MITLTGIDERTDLAAVKELSNGVVEFAVLFSGKSEGRHRYPTLEFIAKALDYMGGELAVHVCGGTARKMLMLENGNTVFRKASRIQINGVLSEEELKTALALYDRQTIITQHTEHNRKLLMTWGDGRHSLLVDNSGGRGITPGAWKMPCTSKPVGFAGGLGSDTLTAQMAKMPQEFFARYQWWVDMESSLRDEQDWFSIERAKACIEKVHCWRGSA